MTEKTKDFLKITTKVFLMLYIWAFALSGIFYIKNLYNLSEITAVILFFSLIFAITNVDNKKLIVKYGKSK